MGTFIVIIVEAIDLERLAVENCWNTLYTHLTASETFLHLCFFDGSLADPSLFVIEFRVIIMNE